MFISVASQVPELDLGPGGDRSQRVALGKRLAAEQGRLIDGLRIEKARVQHGSQEWRLTKQLTLGTLAAA